jgi:cytoskeleton protein RodZ
MFQIGESLREARTRRGLSAADVHKAIRIRERYLTALEEERWDMLPGDVYTRGFLRTYAEFLGLDGDLYADEYNARVAHHDEEAPLAAVPVAAPRRVGGGVVRTAAAVLALVGVAGGLAAWQLGGSSSTTPPLPTQPATTSAPAVTRATPVTPALRRRPAFALISAARGRCWLLVRAGSASGNVVFAGTLEQGQARRFALHPSLWLRIGAPAAIDIRVAGRLVTTLPSGPGNVLLTRTGAAPA